MRVNDVCALPFLITDVFCPTLLLKCWRSSLDACDNGKFCIFGFLKFTLLLQQPSIHDLNLLCTLISAKHGTTCLQVLETEIKRLSHLKDRASEMGHREEYPLSVRCFVEISPVFYTEINSFQVLGWFKLEGKFEMVMLCYLFF